MEQVPSPHERRLWPAGRIVACLLAGLVGSIASALLGLIVGATYGGNHAPDFEFNGMRGYEATGQIGAILGFIAGGALSALLICFLTKGRR